MKLSDNRQLVQVVIQYLKSFGIKTKNWRLVIEQHKEKTYASNGLFGTPLYALPLCSVSENEVIPQFLVDACEFLSRHLCIEGLFRKSGSVVRVKDLKGRLEAGEKCLESSLPYDVAMVVKQFLRDLPEPLIPRELQDMLCQAQLIPSESERTLVTILTTCLLPKLNAATLKYFFKFLQSVASRCEDNKMDCNNLSMVFAPTLFLSLSLNDGHMINAEKQLHLQTSAVQFLIIHADKIGELPQFILGKSPSMFQLELKCQPLRNSKEMKCVLRKSSSRRYRYSVGEMVTVALSRLKGRTTFSSPQSDSKTEITESFVTETSLPSKRKAQEDFPTSEYTAKKRKSGLETVESDVTAAVSAVDQAITPPKAHCNSEVVAIDVPSSPGSFLELSMTDMSNIIASTPKASIQRRRSSKKSERRLKSRDSIRRISCALTLERNETLRKSTRLFNLVRNAKDSTDFPVKCDAEDPINSSWSTKKMTVKHTLEGATFARNEFQLTLPVRGATEPLIAISSSTCEENDYRSSVPLCVPGVDEKGIDFDHSSVAAGCKCMICSNTTVKPDSQEICSEYLQKEQSFQAVNVSTVSGNVTQNKDILESDRKEPGMFCEVIFSTDDHYCLSPISDELFSHVSSNRVLRRSLSLPKDLGSQTPSGGSEGKTNSVNQDLVSSDFHQLSPNVKSLLVEKMPTAEDGENNINSNKQHCDSQKTYFDTSHSSTVTVQKPSVPAVFLTLDMDGSDKSYMPSHLDGKNSLVCSSVYTSKYIGCLQNEPGLPTERLIMKETKASHLSVADYVHKFNNLSVQSLSRQDAMKAANVQQPPPQESRLETKQNNANSPCVIKRRGARRFGRSLSHESALAIQAKQDLSEAEATSETTAKNVLVTKNNPILSQYKSPLESFKKYSRQIFISKKNITLNYASRDSVKKNLATGEGIARQGCTASALN
ncbi:uncharacterized protein LOC122811525 [Protopterus annectens]|uniref:uncharacterized protein LOC122811525 n=1 Tax=Protopterus annectens TaxID=7888 RepID=UPI001CF95B70|nr:uncharacterized protein LOC122811525 [Protopterus annectens]